MPKLEIAISVIQEDYIPYLAFLICNTSGNRKKALHVKVPIITIIEFNEYYMLSYALGSKSGLFLVVLKAHIFQNF